MKIDGKTLFEWWEECWPDLPRWGWDNQPSITQRAFNALAERIKAEMVCPPIVIEDGVMQLPRDEWRKPGAVIVIDPLAKAIESKEPYKSGDVIQLGAIPPGTLAQVGNSNEIFVYHSGVYATDEQMKKGDEALLAKEASWAVYQGAIKNTLVTSASTSNEYSTHHKSCALRHDGITCTCP